MVKYKSYFSLEEVSKIVLYPVNSLYREISRGVISKKEQGVPIRDVLKLLDRRVNVESDKRGKRRNIWLLGDLEYKSACLGFCLFLSEIGVKKDLEKKVEYLLQKDHALYFNPILDWVSDNGEVEPSTRRRVLEAIKGYEIENQEPRKRTDPKKVYIPLEDAKKLLIIEKKESSREVILKNMVSKEGISLEDLAILFQKRFNTLKSDRSTKRKREELSQLESNHRKLHRFFMGEHL